MKDMEELAAPLPRCAICGKPQNAEYRPFCSRRCADVDLGRWMTGAYSAPAEEQDDPDEADLTAELEAERARRADNSSG